MNRWIDRALGLVRAEPTTDETSDTDLLTQEWDRLKAEATSASERAEIDAIFSRNVA